MKVNIYETVEVSPEQRKAIAATIDDAGSKKRDATRDELKEFIWTHGSRWADVLDGRVESEHGPKPTLEQPAEDDADDDMDLI